MAHWIPPAGHTGKEHPGRDLLPGCGDVEMASVSLVGDAQEGYLETLGPVAPLEKRVEDLDVAAL